MDNSEKFSRKSGMYAKYRPSYPKEFIELLEESINICKNAIVADIGAGTGILTKELAHNMKKVYAVEPNSEMRKACKKYCDEVKNVIIIDGSAENTMLPDKSVDVITVAQAFHWFNREKTKSEFQRILRTMGKVVLVWNSRNVESEFIKENYILFKYLCPDFKGFSQGSSLDPNEYNDFFKQGSCNYKVFCNDLTMTFDEYIGRNLSSSYAPLKEDGNYTSFVEGLTHIFNKYSNNGKVLFPQKTCVYIGDI
ncbi:class I SAM-dependent methyltransferase [Clostridium sp. Mt-5]|uniref:Class I SAM-dependent methyltransferase n=1 Tax=Clostridium moutaii TaxID=3240932 RepID=A0ABV4BP84_9CLOT